jgi:ABC-type nitrate/sulfonate/bicarbonate transport system permease component
MPDGRRLILPALVLLGAALLLEAAVALGMTPATIAPPSRIAAALAEHRSLLWFHLEPTLLVAVTGFLIALTLSLMCAVLVYLFKAAEPAVVSIGTIIDSIPMIAISPVLVIWMGLSLPTRITITVLICFFPMFVAILQGLKSAPETAEEMFTNLAATPLQRFRLLAVPYALPYLFVGLKIAAPLAMLGALIAEWTGAERGLGVFILNSLFALRVTDLWAGVFTACAVSTSAFMLVVLFEKLSLNGAAAERPETA